MIGLCLDEDYKRATFTDEIKEFCKKLDFIDPVIIQSMVIFKVCKSILFYILDFIHNVLIYIYTIPDSPKTRQKQIEYFQSI